MARFFHDDDRDTTRFAVDLPDPARRLLSVQQERSATPPVACSAEDPSMDRAVVRASFSRTAPTIAKAVALSPPQSWWRRIARVLCWFGVHHVENKRWVKHARRCCGDFMFNDESYLHSIGDCQCGALLRLEFSPGSSGPYARWVRERCAHRWIPW
jgi:hypothetical protein